MDKLVDFEEALKIAGYGKFNFVLTLICGAGLFTVNTDAYSISYLLPAAQCDLNLSTSEKSILTAVSFIGIICSSHLWGFVADTRGRKNVIIFTLLVSFLCTLCMSFVSNFWIFAILRFISGFFIAGASATLYAYLGEFMSAKYRTISITFASIFVAFGIIVLPGLAWLVIPQDWNFYITDNLQYKSWRVFLLLCSASGLFVALALFFCPESPKFLLLQGKHVEALKVLQNIYAINTGKRAEDYPVTDVAEKNTESNYLNGKEDLLVSMWRQTSPLFHKQYILNSFVSCFIQFGTFAVSSGLLLWYPEIVNQLAEHSRNNPNSSITVCEAISTPSTNKNINNTQLPLQCSDGVDTSVFEQNLIIGLVYVIGTIVITVVVNWVGKKTLLVFLFVSSGVASLALCWIRNKIAIDFLFVGVLSLSGLCVCIINAAVVDLFPTYLRGMAVCISLMCGRLGSVIASSTFGFLFEMNCTSSFIISGITLLVCAALSLFIPNFSTSTETKDESVKKG